ncbi:efflux RND transporter permease subunit [Neptunicella marina]|uniref:Efflux RND transporter permease subunit n=1 Tax=Neptunicella marina TaxID=2125989 RepID=A0A8J6IVK9_9ALTE|nr:efflux RND transporter permease subunit [Neptunicella marina]MBC3766620.1 efflux RND transporter permease subunit [Neptunicella marina]
MNLARFALKNYQVSLVTLLLLVVLGVISLLTMPRSEDPQFDFPAAMITAVLPGTNPIDMEKLIIDPIEEELNELEDIKVIRAEIEDGLALIRIEFLYGEDPDDKYDDVVSAVARIRNDLPQGIQRFSIEKIAPAETSILQLALTSTQMDYRQASYWAEKLKKRLQSIKGVKRAQINGVPEQQVSVRANLQRMRALNISMTQLINAIEGAGYNIPAGHVNAGLRRFSVRTSGDFDNLNQITNTVITQGDGNLIRVSDVADVSIANGMDQYRVKFKQQDAVFINVVQRSGSNIFDVLADVNHQLQDFTAALPDSLTLQTVHDQSIGVEERINSFLINLLQGLFVVGVLTTLLLGMRASLVIVLAIPMSVLIALGWVDLSGYGLQQMSIVGLVIALGLLVDNAIVVTENVARLINKGMDAQQAAQEGASQVALAVASGTLTTILAFFPILLLPSGSGTFMRSMPVTVVFTLFASLLVAIAFTPYLASHLLKPAKKKQPLLQRGLEHYAQHGYRRSLNWSLRNPFKVLILALIIFIGSLSLFPYIGVSLFPKAEKPSLLINVDMPEGSSFERTRQMAEQVANITRSKDIVSSIALNIGRGNPHIYYNVFPNRQVPNFAQLYVKLKYYNADKTNQFIAGLREDFAQLTDVKVAIKEFQQGPPSEAPVEIQLEGDNLNLLRDVAADVEKMVRDTEGTVNVDNPVSKNKIDLQIKINREKAALLGVSIASIDQTVRASLSGYHAGSYRDELGEDFAIVIRKQGHQEPEYEELAEITLQNNQGQLIPLNQVADIQLITDIPGFRHLNLQRMVHVTSDVKNGYQTEVITNSIIEKLEQYSFPQGVHYSIGGEQKNRKESFAGMTKAFIFALLGIFAVLVMQFRSFGQPMIIFAAIPFAISGAFVGLLLSGYTFSFTAFIGLTSLIGIVVNNSIILVDFANQLMREGQNRQQAIIESSVTRLAPIVLTSLTTIGGLLPLTLEGSTMWSPMGWSIIAGLAVSTLLTLFVIPVLYQWFSKPIVKEA